MEGEGWRGVYVGCVGCGSRRSYFQHRGSVSSGDHGSQWLEREEVHEHFHYISFITRNLKISDQMYFTFI